MIIESNNQYCNQYVGLGASSKKLAEKAVFRTSSRSVPAEAGGIANGKQGASPLSQFERANNGVKSPIESEDSLRSQLANATKRILEMQVDPITKKVGDEWVVENGDEFLAAGLEISAVLEEKAELMRGYLEDLGIKGKVTGCGGQTYPNVCFEYYVETEGDGENLFILELENGELVFAETNRSMGGSYEDSHSWARDFANLQFELYGFANEKGPLSNEELKTLYAKFFGIEEMKDISELKTLTEEFNVSSTEFETAEDLLMEALDAKEKPEESELRKAIKDYQDEMLTGLTEDEKKEIDAKLDAYRKECVEAGMGAEAVQTAVNDYYRSLLKEYGAKFDIADAVATDGATSDIPASSGVSGADTGAVKSLEANTVNKTDMKTEVQTDSDGTVYLLITSPNGISMKIKIGNNGNDEDESLAGVQKAQRDTGIKNYENSIDAFFEKKIGNSFVS